MYVYPPDVDPVEKLPPHLAQLLDEGLTSPFSDDHFGYIRDERPAYSMHLGCCVKQTASEIHSESERALT